MSFDIDTITQVYVCAPLVIPTSLLVIFWIVILSRLVREASIFVFLRLECIFNLIDCLMGLFLPFSVQNLLIANLNTFIINFINFVLLYFLTSVFEMCSMIMAILAALNCLSMLSSNKTPRYSILFEINPNFLALGAFALSILNFSFQLVSFVDFLHTSEASNSTTGSNYSQNSQIYLALSIFSYSNSNLILVLILVIINCLILFKLKQNLNNTAVEKNTVLKRKTNERRITKLILADSFFTLVSRVGTLVYIIMGYLVELRNTDFPTSSFFMLLTDFSCVIKFFFFFSLNVRFKRETHMVIKSIKEFLICNKSK